MELSEEGPMEAAWTRARATTRKTSQNRHFIMMKVDDDRVTFDVMLGA